MKEKLCSDCYNGCEQIVSDRCVKYTGVDIPLLNVKNGDSLSYLEQAIVTFLNSVIEATGIKINLPDEIYCNIVKSKLPNCEDVNALNLFRAIIEAVCELKILADQANSSFASINSPYTVSCLSGVNSNSGIKAILQATINKLCSVDTTLTALALDVANNYVKIADINTYIQNYIDTVINPATRYSARMVPYSIIPYYGSLIYFDSTGKGLPNTPWEDIYICNGNNGTPDLRGRVLVGTVDGVPGPTLPPDVNPSNSSFNPNYSLGMTHGSNSITLTLAQIPNHTHLVSDPGHYTRIVVAGSNVATWDSTNGSSRPVTKIEGYSSSTPGTSTTVTTSILEYTGITVSSSGGGNAHSNIQPVRAVHFIMYIP